MRVIDAYDGLVELGESIDDEWSYVNDLAEAWRQRLTEVAELRPSGDLPDRVTAAIDLAIAEIGMIDDPHRAIDWLSTFPQVVILAMGDVP